MSNRCCNRPGLGVVNEPFFCPRMQAYVVRGPRGATGPQGPQGPQGLAGVITNNATFAQNSALTVLSNGNIPFTTNVELNGNKITHTEGSTDIILNAGTYFIVWSGSVISGEVASPVTVAIRLNGFAQLQTTSLISPLSNSTSSITGNTILTVPQNSTLNLQNISAGSVTFSNIVLSIINIT